MQPPFDISVIVPAKDEQERLPRFLSNLIAHCRQSKYRYEIIVVDDGSRDGTSRITEDFQKKFPDLSLIRLKHNRGKGYAVKCGFFAAQGDIVLFLDADGSTPAGEIERHLHYFKKGYDIVIGSRVLKEEGLLVKTLAYRKWIGIIFNFFVHVFLIKNIQDTQCGFKMFRKNIIRPLWARVCINGFGFDLEVLFLAQKMNYKIKEVAVEWAHVHGSKIHLFKDSLQMLTNIFQIRSWHHLPINMQVKHMPAEEMANMYKQEKEHWWFQVKKDFIRAILEKEGIKPQLTLDAGCGTGHNMEFLRAETCYVGSDASREALLFCRQNGVQYLTQSDLENLSFRSKTFDLVLSLDVIEHVEDPLAAVKELKRTVKDGGKIIIMVPAFRFLWSPHDEALSHMRRYNRKDLLDLLEDAGLRVEKEGYLFFGTFVPVVVIRMVRKLFAGTKTPRSDTFHSPPAIVNRTLYALLRMEAQLLGKFRFPFGTSLYAVASSKIS